MAKNKHKSALPNRQGANHSPRINKGYSETGASYTRKALKGFTAKSGSPNEDINYNVRTLRERSRILAMSGGLALSALKTNRTNVIGCGLIFKSAIDKDVLGLTDEEAKAWQDKTEKEFALWAENKNHCDAIGMNDYYKMQQLAFYNALMNGDVFTLMQRDEAAVNKLMPYSLRLNIVEADRVQTPTSSGSRAIAVSTDGKNSTNGNRIYDGIEVNKQGKAIAIHVRNNYEWEMNAEPTEWKRVEIYGPKTGLYNVIHTMCDVERPGQYRGIPFIAPVIEMILQIRRYTDSELTAAVVESLFTAFVKTNTRDDELPLDTVNHGEEPIITDDTEYEMAPGNVIKLQPGEDVTFGDPKRPANGFQNFIEAVAVQVGASLEIPKEMLLKQFNSSYSASRAALLEFWKLVKMRREWFVSDWCRPIYENWLYEAVARGRIKAPGFFDDPIIRMAWLGAEFRGPSQGMLDPTKEIQAEVMMCENGFSTRADSAIRLNGSEYEKNITALKLENEKLYEVTIPQGVNEVKQNDEQQEAESET